MKGKALGAAVGAVSALIVLAALVPTLTAQPPAAGPVHEIPFTPPAALITATIYVGEYVRIGTLTNSIPPGAGITALTLQQQAEPYHSFDIPVTAVTDPVTGVTYLAASMEISDDVVAGYTGLYNIFAAGVDVGDVSIVEPSLSITVRDDRLEAGGQEISSAVFGQTVWVYADTNLPSTAVVDLVRTDPEGSVYKTRTTIGALTAGVPVTISPPDWITGTHELKFEVVENQCWGISKSECPCDPISLTVGKGEITIEMPEHATVGEKVTITIKGPANVPFQCHVVTHAGDVMVTSGEADPYGLGAGILDYDGDGVPDSEVPMSYASIPNPPSAQAPAGIAFADGFSGVTDENGEYKFVVYFRDDRTYTFRVEADVDTDGAWLEGPEEWEEEDIDVSPITVEFDIPRTAIIGTEVKIRGTCSAGRSVDIVIDDILVADDEPLDESKQFEIDWDTSGRTVGSYKIEVYVDCEEPDTVPGYAVGSDVSDILDNLGIDPDGTTTIRLVEPTVTAELTRDEVAKGDSIVVRGTAYGVDEVDIVVVGPKGCTALPADGDYDDEDDLVQGLYFGTATVKEDDTFEEEIEIPEDADAGIYLIAVLTPGRDGNYGDSDYEDGDLMLYLVDEYVDDADGDGISALAGDTDDVEIKLVGKNRDQLLSILEDYTFGKAGSDDLVAGPLTFRVASPYVEIEEIASVPVGEPLVINGTSNREDGTIITVTVKAGPAYEKIPSATTEVIDGKWSVTLDTSDAEPGIYTVEAEDEDGNVDEATFELLPAAAVTPTPSPTPPVEVTPTPSPTPPVEVTPTPSPTPAATPSPTPPGFTAVFTIAGILAVAYLIIRRRK